MPRPSQEAGMLAAALACFAELGYDATRVRTIAERAGVSEGALYRHYPSKEAIASALFRQHLTAFTLELQQAAQTAQTPEAQVRTLIVTTLASYRANPAAFTFVLLRQSGFLQLTGTDTRYPLDVLEDVVQRGQAVGAIRAGPPSLLAAVLFGCVLRPIIVAQLAHPGAVDLLRDRSHDTLIADLAWAALKIEG